jgi:hypothetical protein
MTLQPQTLLGRLAFVRYVYELAVHQSRQSGRQQITSILTFHDAVEMALVLGLQHHDVQPQYRDTRFMQYWSELERVDVHLTQYSTMETLNRVRVNLKHHGVVPAPTEIESARVHAHDFFVENIPIMFSLNLEDASLVSIVSYDEARGHLEAAEAYARQQSYNDTITEIAYAFHALIEEYERRMSSVYGRSPYLFSAVSGYVSPWDPVGLLNVQSSGPLTGPLSINLAAGPRPADVRQQALERFAHDVGPALGAIQKGLKILSLGLDYNRYVRFTHLTPSVTRHNGHLTCPAALNMNRREVTSEECQDCIDFVIDAALRLQEAERE